LLVIVFLASIIKAYKNIIATLLDRVRTKRRKRLKKQFGRGLTMQDKPAILLLCASSKLADSVKEILEEDYELVLAKTLNQAFTILDEQKPAVAVLDFAAATSFDGDSIEQLEKHSPNIVNLLVCPRDKRDQLLESNLSNQVFRVLFATLSPGQTRLAVSAAFKHSKSKDSDTPQSQPKSAQSKTKPVNKTTTESNSKLIPIIAGVAVLAIAGLGLMFMSGDKSETNEQTVENQETQKTPEDIETDKLTGAAISAAQLSLSNGILFPPDENNALDAFTAILEKSPNNLEAKKGLVELGKKALGSLDSEIANGSLDDAQASISRARSLAANNTVFSELIETNIADKRANLIKSAQDSLNNGSVFEAKNTIDAAKILFTNDSEILSLDVSISEQMKTINQASEIETLVTSATEAINANRLISPNRNNAQFFINRLESLDSANSNLNTLKRNFSSALLVEARSRALGENFTQAKRLVDVAAQMGASSAAVNSEKSRISSLERKVRDEKKAQEDAAAELAAAQELAESQRQANQAAADRAAAERQAEQDRQAEQQRLATIPVDVKINDLTSVTRGSPEYPSSYLRLLLSLKQD